MTDVKTNAFVEAIKNINPYSLKENEILTENGAIQLKSSGSNIVDQFGKAGNYRGRSIDDVWDEQNEIWNENSEAALRFPFYLRMITRKVKINDKNTTDKTQSGQGARDESFKRLLWIAETHPNDFYKNIYVVASQQNLHFQQWIQILELMGYEWARDCVHVPFGLVSLEDGTMSTRHGRVVFLEDVLNRAVEKTREIIEEKGVATENIDETAKQVGIGAVIFNELSNNRIKDYVFSWDKVLDFNGETGPYVQYTYARCASVLRNAGEEAAAKAADPAALKPQYLTSESAFQLVRLLYKLPEVIREAGDRYEPSIVTRHIVDIAQSFNRFYHDEHILVEDEEEKTAKLALVLAAKTAIRNGLALLGMEAPERM